MNQLPRHGIFMFLKLTRMKQDHRWWRVNGLILDWLRGRQN